MMGGKIIEDNQPELDLMSESEWIGMPEFEMKKVEPYSTITVRFRNEEDLSEFAKIIGQKLTDKTKSIWHPYKPHSLPNKKMYFYEP